MARDPGFAARRYIAIATATVLLLWDPLDSFLPPWFALRMGCLIVIPLATWLLLQWAWKAWKPDYTTEDRISRALYATTAGALLALAIHDGHAKTHHGNTAVIQTRDEIIEYGDDVVLSGPDRGRIAMTLLFAGIAFWFSVAPDEKLDDELEQISSLVIDVNRPFGEKYSVHMSNGRIYPIKLEEFESLKKQHLDIDEW